MTKDIKTVAVVAVGVFVAGLVMNQFRDIGIVKMAHDGFDGIG